MTKDDKFIKQVDLEELMSAEGRARFLKQREKDTLGAGGNKVSNMLITHNIEKIALAIDTFIEESLVSKGSGRPSKHASVAVVLEKVLPSETLAFIALQACFQGCGAGTSKGSAKTLITFAKDIVDNINTERQFIRFKKAHPGLFRWVAEEAKESLRVKTAHTLAVARKAAKGKDIRFEKMSIEDEITVGYKLIDIVVSSTGLFEEDLQVMRRNDTKKVLRPSAELLEWVKRSEAKELGGASGFWLPMVIKPLQWTNPFDGGYITHRSPLVRTQNKNYLQELQNTNPTEIYRAVNAIQETPWKVNEFVLDVAKHYWETLGGGFRGLDLPAMDGDELPIRPEGIDTDKEILKQWKKLAAATYRKNHKGKSKVISVMTKLWIAEKYRKEDAIYFPHFLDWRGRAYPTPVFLNPQGDDLAKSLLMFAEGKPLGSEGAKWLMVHIANSWGYDKADFAGRIRWVQDHEEMVLNTAISPLESFEWHDASDPWLFLAACKEYLGYKMQGESYVSHINIQLDGAANGLQNLSAMILDEEGGRATALVPSEKPSDIYTTVMNKAIELMEEDLKDPELAEMAEELIRSINRSWAKRPTMTTPYGVTFFGIKEQIRDELNKQMDAGLLELECDVKEAASYLGRILFRAIRDTVKAAGTVMDWLQDVSKLVAQNELPVWWSTPLGFPVLQEYRAMIHKKVNIHYRGMAQQVKYARKGSRIDSRKQALGISPNVIHSLDGDHLKRTALMCVDNGITDLAFIHDSFGTHAANTGAMAYLLREAFIEQYSTVDVLLEFRKEIVRQLEGYPELIEQIPELPTKGSLDLSQIRFSDYFFA